MTEIGYFREVISTHFCVAFTLKSVLMALNTRGSATLAKDPPTRMEKKGKSYCQKATAAIGVDSSWGTPPDSLL